MYIYHLIEDKFEEINNMSIEFNKKKILKYEYLYDFVINGVVINNSRFFLDSKLFIYYIFKGKFHKKYCTIKYYSPIIDKDFQHMKNHLMKKYPDNKNIRFILPTSYDDYLDTVEFFIGRNGRCFFF
tara:strand:- start:1602 stop:1982 length:381 start_codon:yes stop_codon:yes gene_type:complete